MKKREVSPIRGKSGWISPEFQEIILHDNYANSCFRVCLVENIENMFIVCLYSDAQEDNESKDRLSGLQSAESENETRCSSLGRRSRKVGCNQAKVADIVIDLVYYFSKQYYKG